MIIAARVAAILLILIGLLWLGQGLGLIAGSVMTGQAFWAFMGLLCLAAGAYLAYIGFRRRPRQP